MNNIKPLQPLTYGNVLIVGAKPSNFDNEILEHPRVILWSSQEEHWTNKNLPTNVRAVFITRWIGHVAFNRILKEARKRHITIFNPSEGTGMIAKQVRELLTPPQPQQPEEPTPTTEEPEAPVLQKKKVEPGKLTPLIPLIDFDKPNVENARVMLERAKELGIATTFASLCQMVTAQRRKVRKLSHVPKKSTSKTKDVAVEMFDEALKSLADLRSLFVDTVKENNELKARVARFKKLLED